MVHRFDVFIIIVVLVFVGVYAYQTIEAVINPEMCPIFYQNESVESIPCYSVNWDSYCESIGCEKHNYWCGRPGCECRERLL